VNADGEAWLFSYGTLRDPQIQRALFGRMIEREPDALPGHRLILVTIGGTEYSSLEPSTHAADPVPGVVLRLTADELARADAYEGSTDYVRVTVQLESGREAFAYLSAR
jgi:gamma-glutamylcyclotransferase (GGCT)/AIG2-like uncharacterized protein YtfP